MTSVTEFSQKAALCLRIPLHFSYTKWFSWASVMSSVAPFFFPTSACCLTRSIKTDAIAILLFTIHAASLWQSSWICYLFTVDIMKHRKKSLSLSLFFSFSDALHYQIRGKHVFPNAVISQRYKLQPYHNEKGMQSAAFLSAWKMFTVSKQNSQRYCSSQHAVLH